MNTRIEKNNVLAEYASELAKLLPGVDFKVAVKPVRVRYQEAVVSITFYNVNLGRKSNEVVAYTLFREGGYKDKIIGTYTYKEITYNMSASEWGVREHGPCDLKFDHLNFSYHQKQSAVKVDSKSLHEVLLANQEDGKGEIIFGVETSKYGIANKTMNVSLRTDEGLRVFALPTRGFLVELSRCLGEGGHSQDALLRYPSVFFEV